MKLFLQFNLIVFAIFLGFFLSACSESKLKTEDNLKKEFLLVLNESPSIFEGFHAEKIAADVDGKDASIFVFKAKESNIRRATANLSEGYHDLNTTLNDIEFVNQKLKSIDKNYTLKVDASWKKFIGNNDNRQLQIFLFYNPETMKVVVVFQKYIL
jgi:hypothetical protein